MPGTAERQTERPLKFFNFAHQLPRKLIMSLFYEESWNMSKSNVIKPVGNNHIYCHSLSQVSPCSPLQISQNEGTSFGNTFISAVTAPWTQWPPNQCSLWPYHQRPMFNQCFQEGSSAFSNHTFVFLFPKTNMNYLSILMCSSSIKEDFLINKEYKFCMMCAQHNFF